MAAKSGKPKQPSAGLRITPESEKAALAASIKTTLDASAPKQAPQLPRTTDRELGAMTAGERLPMDHPAPDAPASEREWFAASHSNVSEMGIVVEPEGEHAWLALQSHPSKKPLLLYRLPLINFPRGNNPF